MKHILLIAAVFSVSACGFWGGSDEEAQTITIVKEEKDQQVMRSGTSAFDSCPPLHAEQGRC